MQTDLAAQWDRLSPLLDEALALDPERRAEWLAALPPEHAPLRAPLERLLARQKEAAGFLERQMPEAGDARAVGDVVGGFRLVTELGRGGMGAVWLAERTEGSVRLPVALKLPFLDGPIASVRERFERERAILAALNHPNIARLYEAGITAEGQPYLALEYVEGEPLLTHCREQALPIRARIELFLQVLAAVRYAHANLVIHRDLKPSNIVLTRTGEVKLLDFGIAKLLDRDTQRTEQTELTRAYGRLMTLDYASPEQVRGLTLTTATDVYSLGVVLYELLSGTRPYRLKRGSAAELEEAILTAETAPPSHAVTAAVTGTARAPLARWRRALRGDLDTIVLKALEKSTAARYPTAEAFARDCERFLQGRPVLAQPQRPLYRAAKFVRRHRFALAAAAAISVALLTGTAVAVWQARVAIAQTRVAEDEAAKQRAVQSFLTALFDRNTRLQPDAARARNMTVRELLLEASGRVEGSFDGAPSVKLEVANTVARLLRDIDEYGRAAELNRHAVELARAHRLTTSDAYVEALMGLATAERLLGNGESAVAARDESLQVLDARGDRTSLLRARANANTVAQFTRDVAREIALVEEAATLFEQRYPAEPERFTSLYYLANLHRTQGNAALAGQYFRKAIAVFGETRSRDYTSLGASHAFVGAAEIWLGRTQDALRSYETGLGLLERHAGAAALNTRFQRALYAEVLHFAGRPVEAHAQFARVAHDRGDAPPTIADFDAAVYRSWALIEEGRPAEALAVLAPYETSWVELGRRYVPNGRRWAIQVAFVHAMRARPDEARAALRRLSELPATHYGESLEASADYAIEAAWIELAAGDAQSAWTTLHRWAEADEDPEGYSGLYVRGRTRAAEIALARGEATAAVELARRALDHIEREAGAGAFPYLETRALAMRGEARLAAGELREARADLQAAIASMKALHSPDSPWLLQSTAALAETHARLGEGQRAAALNREARAISRRQGDLAPILTARLTGTRPAAR